MGLYFFNKIAIISALASGKAEMYCQELYHSYTMEDGTSSLS
jgi:hypothetical protein